MSRGGRGGGGGGEEWFGRFSASSPVTNLSGPSIEKRLAEIALLEVKGSRLAKWATNKTRKRTKTLDLCSKPQFVLY